MAGLIDLGGSKQDVYGQKCAVTCIPFGAHDVCPQGISCLSFNCQEGLTNAAKGLSQGVH